MSLPTRQANDDATNFENSPSDPSSPSSGSTDHEANVYDSPSEPANPSGSPDIAIDLNTHERDIIFALTRLRGHTFDQIVAKTGIDTGLVQHGLTRLLSINFIEQRTAEPFASIYDISPTGLAWVRSKGYRD